MPNVRACVDILMKNLRKNIRSTNSLKMPLCTFIGAKHYDCGHFRTFPLFFFLSQKCWFYCNVVMCKYPHWCNVVKKNHYVCTKWCLHPCLLYQCLSNQQTTSILWPISSLPPLSHPPSHPRPKISYFFQHSQRSPSPCSVFMPHTSTF